MKRVLSIGLLLSVIVSISPVSAMDFSPSAIEATRLPGSVTEQVVQQAVAPTWKEAVLARAQGFVAATTQTGSALLAQGKNLVERSTESLKTRGSEVIAQGSSLVKQGTTAAATKGSALYAQGSALVRQGATAAVTKGSALLAQGKGLVSQAGTYLVNKGNRVVELAQPTLVRGKELLGAARDYAVTNGTKAIELVKENPKMAAAIGLGTAAVTGLTIYGIKKYNAAKKNTIAIDQASLDLNDFEIVAKK